MNDLCPLCHRPLPATELVIDDETRSVIRGGKAIVLAPKVYRLFSCLVRRRPRGASKDDLWQAMYFDDPDGGPERVNCIPPFVNQLNKYLAPLGVHINKANGWDRVYTIVEDLK